MIRRGDVVIVDFPFADGRAGKVRPALIVQADRENGRLRNTIVAMISGNTRHSHEPTQLLVDVATPEGAASGLHGTSAVKCTNLFTVAQTHLLTVIGQLSPAMMSRIDSCLKAAMGIA